jgi:hypothetical protein
MGYHLGVRIAKLVRAAGVVALCSWAGTAHAARSAFGWLHDIELNPERGVELEQWMTEEHGKDGGNVDVANLWWAAVIGITDRLELALPVEWRWEDDGGGMAVPTQLYTWGAELRWRLVTSDPVDAPCAVPVLRLGVNHVITDGDRWQIEAGGVVGFTRGRLRLLADADVLVETGSGDTTVEVHPGVGATVAVTDDLRVGAEAYATFDVKPRDSAGDWIVVGPNVAWTHGRFWLTAAIDVGVHQIDLAPRLKWGVAF